MYLQVVMLKMGLLRENGRRLDAVELELRGLSGQIFRGFSSFVAAVDELFVVQKRLLRK